MLWVSEGKVNQQTRPLFRALVLFAGLYWATLDPIDLFLTATCTHVEPGSDQLEQDEQKSVSHHELIHESLILPPRSVSHPEPLPLGRLAIKHPWKKPPSPDTSRLAPRAPPVA
jgi:hypothetical protein